MGAWRDTPEGAGSPNIGEDIKPAKRCHLVRVKVTKNEAVMKERHPTLPPVHACSGTEGRKAVALL